MKIALHSKIYNSKKILARLEEEFGGITQDKPDFILSGKDDVDVFEIVEGTYSDEYEATKYMHSINDFLKSRFPKTYAACK
jgi:hypothetical protein